MWKKPANFVEIRDVYLQAKSRTNSKIEGIKAIRDAFPLSLVNAKNLMYWIEDGCDIVEGQKRLFDNLVMFDSEAYDEEAE